MTTKYSPITMTVDDMVLAEMRHKRDIAQDEVDTRSDGEYWTPVLDALNTAVTAGPSKLNLLTREQAHYVNFEIANALDIAQDQDIVLARRLRETMLRIEKWFDLPRQDGMKFFALKT